MTSLTARNRANALKSTGPKTPRGKAVVAQNARRHGVTSKPDPTSVALWLRIILDTPDLGPGDLLRGDGRTARALALAEAEVRFRTARAALDEFERPGARPSDFAEDLQHHADEITAALQEKEMAASMRGTGLPLLWGIAGALADETAPGGKRHRLLQRYLREARARRRRAFEGWMRYSGLGGAATENAA